VEHYSQKLDLPFSNISLSFRELKTKDQILLSKAIMSFSNRKEDFLNYHNFVLNIISKCVQNVNDIDKINIIEYVLFLVKFRMISIGTSVSFLLNTDGTKKTKLKIDLKTYLTNLYNASMSIRDDELLIDKDVEIKISWPNIKSIPNFYKNLLNNSSEYFLINNTLYEFIEHIKFNNKKIILTNFSSQEKQNIFEKLSVSLKQKIQDIVINKVKFLIESDLFGLSYFKDYKFNLYSMSFLEHIRLFFSYDLKSLYQEIYILSGSGLSTEYIMDISPTERNIYFTIMQEQKASQNKKSSPEDNIPNQSLEDLALEFGDVPP
jgi:hypothetical protein